MTTPLLEMEGTAEEIRERLADFGGLRLRVTVRAVPAVPEPPGMTESPARSISEQLMDLFGDAPPEERARVPADLTDNLDHYIYGLPKK